MPHSVETIVMTLPSNDPTLTSHHHQLHQSSHDYNGTSPLKSPMGNGWNGSGGNLSTKFVDVSPRYSFTNGRPNTNSIQCDGSSITESIRTASLMDRQTSSATDGGNSWSRRTPSPKEHQEPTSYFPNGNYNMNAMQDALPASTALIIQTTTKYTANGVEPAPKSAPLANGTSSLLDAPVIHSSRFSSPPALNNSATPGPSTPTTASQLSQQTPTSMSLRHRHTLQVPTPSKTGRVPARDDGPTPSGRLSPTGGPRRASTNLGRRGTRSIHSDMHIDEIPQDDDAHKWAEAIKAKRANKRRRREEDDDDRVVVGTKVDQNHVNWTTAYNMLTGIRFVVSRVNAKMDRPLTDADFTAKNKFSFDMYAENPRWVVDLDHMLTTDSTGNELTPSAKYDFKFKDYSPWVFRHLRRIFGLDPADYLMSLTSKYILSELGSPGKSGSFFYFSRDYKYIIKTIHRGEHKYLRKILRLYHAHVAENPNTLISQFYGLHRVKTPFGRKIYFVVMNNLFPPHRDIHQTFDLKGSTIGRDYHEADLAENPRATLKDLNWLRRNMNLELGPSKKRIFLEQLEKDVACLKRLGVMDYSLLLGIHDLTRGNKDDIRNSALKVFQPGIEHPSESTDGHPLQRTPSKLESARKARELRKIINKEVPVQLDQTENRLPEEAPAFKEAVFYRDDGGFRATHENDEPGDVVYYLGIIDCLTHYGMVKKVEHFWKGLKKPKDKISAIPPEGYGDRFLNFIRKAVKSPEEAEREREQREREQAEAGLVIETAGAAPTRPDEVSEALLQAHQEPERRIGTIRSPSTERSNGVNGTILPVVLETGEGSIRTKSREDSQASNINLPSSPLAERS